MRGPIIAIVLGLAMLGCGLGLLFAQRAQEQSERYDRRQVELEVARTGLRRQAPVGGIPTSRWDAG